jgi:hypothetical protein
MPIEIRELHIKVNVASQQGEQTSAPSSSSGPGGNAGEGSANEEIIAACVEKVMEILQNKTER